MNPNLKLLLICISLMSCHSDDKSEDEIQNLSDYYSECNRIVSESCSGYSGDYCLFGYKFGEDPAYTETGINAIGPQSPGGIVSFSFHENTTVNTHRQINIPTQSFDELPSCAKDQIRTALNEWSTHAQISFEEEEENSDSNIKFFAAKISTGGVGYPNYQTSPCNELAGHIILHPDFTSDCEVFYRYTLHEIGHTLGLGHSSTENIMGANIKTTILSNLQAGDIAGIKTIYGEKNL